MYGLLLTMERGSIWLDKIAQIQALSEVHYLLLLIFLEIEVIM